MKSDTQLARASAALQGRELDALVAELVMGWTRSPGSMAAWDGPHGTAREGKARPLAYFSTEIHAAWMVVEKMRERGFGVEIGHGGTPGWGWYASFVRNAAAYTQQEDYVEATTEAAVRAISAPLAICRAALAALEQGQAPEEPGDMGRL